MLTALRFGIIFVLMEFIWIIGEYLVGLHTTHIRQHYLYTNLMMIPATAIMVWGLVARRDEQGGELSYTQALGQGALIGVVVGILSIGVHYLFFTYINPNFFVDFQRLAVLEGHMTREGAETYFSLSTNAWQSAVFSPVAGLLTNALTGLFLETRWR